MSDTGTTEYTHCIACGHPTDPAHPTDADGRRPCRSYGHPAGMTCTECIRLTGAPALAAMQERRGTIYDDRDSPEARAWAAFNTIRDMAKHEMGPGWQAFYTDIHQSALIVALTEYDAARAEAGR